MNQIVTFDKMQVGHKGNGKHWTKEQVVKRTAAAQSIKRKKTVKLKPPEWLKNDIVVFRIWQEIIKEAKALELLDNLDANALATYCKLEADKEKSVEDKDIFLFERLAKTSLQYAKTLGLTPEGRARLAKRKAEGKEDPNADLFD